MHIQSSGFTAACTLEAVLLLAAGRCCLSEHWPAYTPFQVQKDFYFKINIKSTAGKILQGETMQETNVY
jgi:hypothetical protein